MFNGLYIFLIYYVLRQEIVRIKKKYTKLYYTIPVSYSYAYDALSYKMSINVLINIPPSGGGGHQSHRNPSIDTVIIVYTHTVHDVYMAL